MKQALSQKQLRVQLEQSASDIRVIDIRTKEEFEKRHIPTSENIPAEILTKKSGAWDKNSTIVCVCNRGHERSQNGAEQLSETGFKNVFYLEGGVVGWFEELA